MTFSTKDLVRSDFSGNSVEDACHHFGVTADKLTAYVSEEVWLDYGIEIANDYTCKVIAVPKELLADEDAWGILYDGK